MFTVGSGLPSVHYRASSTADLKAGGESSPSQQRAHPPDKMNHSVLGMKFTSFPQAEDSQWVQIGALNTSLNCSWSTISLEEEFITSRTGGSFFPTYKQKCTWQFNKNRTTNHSLRAPLGANNKNSYHVLHQPGTVLKAVSFHSPPNPVMKPLLSSPFYKWENILTQRLIYTQLVKWPNQNSNMGLSVPKALCSEPLKKNNKKRNLRDDTAFSSVTQRRGLSYIIPWTLTIHSFRLFPILTLYYIFVHIWRVCIHVYPLAFW